MTGRKRTGAKQLIAPFPYMGGKSRIAHAVWERFGNPPRYIEPFFGSGAVLLARPDEHSWWTKTEIVNDADGLLCVGPATKILRSDRRWCAAADVAPGDVLVGFDEFPEALPAPQVSHPWRAATVLSVATVQRQGFRLRFHDGTEVVASTDHLWLGWESPSAGPAAQWIMTAQLCAEASCASSVAKVCDPAAVAAGWLPSSMEAVRLVEKSPLGVIDVVAIETDTHTYVAEGLASHNCNFWRATAHDPEAVAAAADWPVFENDLHARHAWLCRQREEITRQLEGDPEWYDARAAGWWVWGISCWIGGGWCSGHGPWQVVDGKLLRVGGKQAGHGADDAAGVGVQRRLPVLSCSCGVHRSPPADAVGDLDLGVGPGCEVTDPRSSEDVLQDPPEVGESGLSHTDLWTQHLRKIFATLHNRMRSVKVCCGDWSRVCSPSPMRLNYPSPCGVFLDPPYSNAERERGCYVYDDGSVAAQARAWAIEHGENPKLRIAFCGYSGEHDDWPDGWTELAWKAKGGYGNRGHQRGRANTERERIWFSPHCLRPEDLG